MSNKNKNKKKSELKRIKHYYSEINSFMYMMRKDRLDTYASSAAFFMFLSLIPFLLLIFAIIPYTPISEQYLTETLILILPDKVSGFATAVIDEVMDENIALLSVSALAALWSASKTIQQLKLGLDEIHECIQFKTLFFVRLSAIFYTILFILATIILLVMSIFSENIIHAILNFFPVFKRNQAIADIIRFLSEKRGLVFIPIIFVIVLIFYCRMPRTKQKVKTQWVGALGVGIVWFLFSKVFNIYINQFNAYSMYGSLALVIIIMFWLYACMIIFFTGALINYYLSLKHKGGKLYS